MRRSAWRRKRLNPAGILGWAMMAAGAAAVIGSLAVDEARGIPGWEPVNSVVREALAEETAKSASGMVAPKMATAEETGSAAGDETASVAESETPQPASPAIDTTSSPLLDLNTATEEQLDALPGIGPAKARAIIAYRESGRPFRSVDDLLNVKGIGPKLLEQIRPFVRAGNSGGA